MAVGRMAASATRPWVPFALLLSAWAAPSVIFPFNSQMPTVARVNRAYIFQISGSTFASATGNITYSLSNQPQWLSINTNTGALGGSPMSIDEGVSRFNITATDATGDVRMPCTLVISSNPPPRLEGDISGQISHSMNLSSRQPPAITFLPSEVIQVEFSRNSFIDAVQRKLYYYATLSDHSPLPSWLKFDPVDLKLSGIAPDLTAYPQSWAVDLIASDVPGFTGSSFSFTVTISTGQMVFVPQTQNTYVNAGEHINDISLQRQLFRNGRAMNLARLVNVSAQVPSWLTFNPETLALEGTVPMQSDHQSLTVSVLDDMGNSATANINLVIAGKPLFAEPVASIKAYSGEMLFYHFPDSLFTTASVALQALLPKSVPWLHFHAETHDLTGDVPSKISSLAIVATLIARDSNTPSQSQLFTVEITSGPVGSATESARLSTRTTPANSSTSISQALSATEHAGRRMDGSLLAAIVLLSLLSAGLLVICLILCCRQRRCRARSGQSTIFPPHATSLPVAQSTHHGLRDGHATQTHNSESGLILNNKFPETSTGAGPQSNLNLQSRQGKQESKWRSRISRASKLSSIGVGGEETLVTDFNIPEPGNEIQVLQKPHHSFYIPTEIARLTRTQSATSRSRHSIQSPSTDGQVWHAVSHTGGREPGSPRPLGNEEQQRQRFKSGISPSMNRDSSTTSFSSWRASITSRRTLHIPRLRIASSSSSSIFLYGRDRCAAEKRNTIRLVDTSEIMSDDRPIDVRRQSFIRARASSGLQNPLFAHGSRAVSSSMRHHERQSHHTRSHVGSILNVRKRTGNGSTHSRASALELQKYLRYRPSLMFPQPAADSRSHISDLERTQSGSGSLSTPFPSAFVEGDLFKQMALHRHERSWVLPGEASPTPPPQPDFAHCSRGSIAGGEESAKLGCSNEHIPAATLPASDIVNLASSGQSNRKIRNRLSEPIDLVNADSIHGTKVRRNSRNRSCGHLSSDKIQSLNEWVAESCKATQAGCEQFIEVDGLGSKQSHSSPTAVPAKGESIGGITSPDWDQLAFI